MLNEFYFYWTEKNKSGSKMKFEMEKTWDTKRRLGTWKRNSKRFEPEEEKLTVHLPLNQD
jgi:hypothetical protein